MRANIPTKYPSQEAATARINDLERQLGKTPTNFQGRGVFINDLWEDIGDLEKEVDAKKQADAQAALDRLVGEGSKAKEPSPTPQEPDPKTAERQPVAATGISRAVAAVGGVKTKQDDAKPLYGVARSIAAVNKN